MYEFAIVVLLGVAAFKLVDVVSEHFDLSAVRTPVILLIGVLLSWGLDFSLFSLWEIAVRSELLGYVGTGLMIAAAGYAMPQALGTVAEVTSHRREARVGRAA
jgi:hypothetical protein